MPELPASLEYLWDMHNEMFSPEPLSFLEIESWARLMRLDLTPEEVRIIKTINRTFWRIHNEAGT